MGKAMKIYAAKKDESENGLGKTKEQKKTFVNSSFHSGEKSEVRFPCLCHCRLVTNLFVTRQPSAN